MLPLTKILSPSDMEHPDMAQPLQRLRETEEKLSAVNLLDPLPTEWRRWEYGMGLRAAELSPEDLTYYESIALEVGGSSSLFMPAAAHYFHFWDLAEEASWVKANEKRVHAQSMAMGMSEYGLCVTELGDLPPTDHQYDFLACISVIENLPYTGPKEEGLYWHSGHTFMLQWIKENLIPRVSPGGILFLTSDIKEEQPDNVPFHWMRPPGIWCPKSWEALVNALSLSGMSPVGDCDFSWKEPVYNGYSFAALTMRRNG